MKSLRAGLKVPFNGRANLGKMVDAVITCSDSDKKRFQRLNGGQLSIEVVPNGVTIPEFKFDAGVMKDQPESILFCGTLSSIPNAEGLHWFCKKIWPLVLQQFPGLQLLVVGSGTLPEKYADIKTTANIKFTGAVPDVKESYNQATIAVVPLLTGSGTRLKILEAMAMGVPVIATKTGAEGIEYMNLKDIIIADREEEFSEKVIQLLKDKTRRSEIAQQARELVREKYDWNIIGNQMEKELTHLINKEKTELYE